jgi:hypothetical protein
MGDPAADAGNREKRRKEVFRDTQHMISKANKSHWSNG